MSDKLSDKDIFVPADSPTVSATPDKDTQRFPDMTEPGSPGRVFGFDFMGFKYGSSDKLHSAAFLLSILMVVAVIILAVISMFAKNGEAASDAVQTLGQVLILTIGVAIGRGASEGNKGQ